MWLIIAAIAIILVSIGLGIGYLARNTEVFRPVLRKPRNITPESLDRSPDDPHMPGASS